MGLSMRDLSVLKERIEYAERHLTASHTARERESHALMAMWQQIRDRFELQEQEISRYRAQLAEMTNVNDELSALVDRLISSVEGGITDSGNETVPTISKLADDLLRSQPPRGSSPAATAPLAPQAPTTTPAPPAATAPTPSEYTQALEDILELDTPAPEPLAEAAPPVTAPEVSFSENLNAVMAADDEDDEISIPSSEPVHEDSASEGIRNLITRIEDAVASPAGATELNGAAPAGDAVSADEEDEDLARELQEIESLRNELNGLRNKISAGN
jgi:hypothetical protein